MSKKLVEIREEFIKYLNDPARLNERSRVIASGFLKATRSKFSADAWDEVLLNGLVQMLGGVRTRRQRPSTGSVDAPDLFASFKLDPIVIVRVIEDGEGVVEKNKPINSITLPEALDCLARFSKEREANNEKAREWRKLIARVKPYMTREGMTLEEGLKLAATADAKKRKRKKDDTA